MQGFELELPLYLGGRTKCSACASAQHKAWQHPGCATLNHNIVPKVLRLPCQRDQEGTDVLVDYVIYTPMQHLWI